MRRRVVITGIGCINPMGHDVETMWAAVLAGRSGVGYTSIFDARNFPTRISAEVRDWDVSQIGEDLDEWKYRGRHTCFAAGAAKQAVIDAGILDSNLPPERFGVYLGSGEGSQDFFSFTRMMASALADGEFNLNQFIQCGLDTLNPTLELEQETQYAGRTSGPYVQCPRAQLQLPDRMCCK